MPSAIKTKSDEEWSRRNECTSIGCALTLVANRLAAVTSLYCRCYENYSDKTGEYTDDLRDENGDVLPGVEVDDCGDPVTEAYKYNGNDDRLQEGLEEISDFAAKFSIPFDFDVTLTMVQELYTKNRDAWADSSGTC